MELDTDRIVTFVTEVTKEEAEAFAKDRLEYIQWEMLQMNRELQLQPVVFTKARAENKSEVLTGWIGHIEQENDEDYIADEEDFNKYFRDPKPD